MKGEVGELSAEQEALVEEVRRHIVADPPGTPIAPLLRALVLTVAASERRAAAKVARDFAEKRKREANSFNNAYEGDFTDGEETELLCLDAESHGALAVAKLIESQR